METFQIILIAVAIIWNVHLVVSMILLWQRRHLDTVRYRSPGLTCLSAIASMVLITIYVALLPMQKFPCFLNLWITSIGQPLLYLTILARAFRLLFFYKFSEARLAVALNKPEKPSYRPKSIIQIFSGSRRKSNGSAYELHGLTECAAPSSSPSSIAQDIQQPLWGYRGNDLSHNWYYRHRYMLSAQFITTVIIIILMFHLCVVFVVQLLSTRFAFYPRIISEDCMRGWEYYPHDVFACIYILIFFPFLIFKLLSVKDAYGIRMELVATSLISCLGFFIFLLTLIVGKDTSINEHVPNSLWWGLPLMVVSFFTVTYPLIKSIPYSSFSHRLSSETEYTMEVFESLLNNPIQFESFKLFTVSDFTIENTLFYERCRNIALSARESNLNDNADLVSELREIYNTFIKNTAEFQVNLESETRKALLTKVENELFSPDMYVPAVEEIKLLMFRNTYLRYLTYAKTRRVDWEGRTEGFV
ncbi:regulator of G protein signaling superfamily [Basidiobolus meristosporus CBS 931.73]|uniref:Regulator of G protein signaling superfamily n=1 Tax=Basidiobolus meristosporus CBS 931.73 TaxID=1314790 RepID=A0A1Y1XU21_9FUNG|nr:regulator of G protein signaling superfamily [Basidiobolus meristosporus CBS 931.73]|eukprot:ORX89249.1 regulator of G protein signaling superfamily [Basidiobolus meristosporus CBS 931.73]